MKKCFIDGCNDKYLAKGLCNKHYRRMKKYEDINHVKIANFSHGMYKSPEYRAWIAMKSRCLNKKNSQYYLYGGRGIKICEQWLCKFENFYKDMGNRPTSSHSLDRIDGDGNYEPNNCRWGTRSEQNRNKSTNRLYKGECAVDAGIRLGGSKQLVLNRINSKGWDIERAFTEPIHFKTCTHEDQSEETIKQLLIVLGE